MSEPQTLERQWTDKFGTHFEVYARDAEGYIHAISLIMPRGGWPPGVIDDARAEARRSAIAGVPK